MERILNVFSMVLAISVTSAIYMSGPCDVGPVTGHSRDPEITARAPAGCNGGILDWISPRGHLLFHVANVNATPTSVCLKDWALGYLFNVTDVTDGRSMPLTNITKETFKCTNASTATELVLRVDAPTISMYIGGFDYLVQRTDGVKHPVLY